MLCIPFIQDLFLSEAHAIKHVIPIPGHLKLILLDTELYINYKVVDMKQGLGELEQTILLAVLRLGTEAYGVSIRSEIAQCTGREIAPGALYTTLDRLEKKLLLVAREGDSTPQRGGRAKRFYTLTRQGRTQLVDAQTSFKRLMEGIKLLA
jgi:PadR family transcriptional regulator PadR